MLKGRLVLLDLKLEWPNKDAWTAANELNIMISCQDVVGWRQQGGPIFLTNLSHQQTSWSEKCHPKFTFYYYYSGCGP
jgi:hypothetical protein